MLHIFYPSQVAPQAGWRGVGGRGSFFQIRLTCFFEALAICENPTIISMRKSKDLKLKSFLPGKAPQGLRRYVLHHGGSPPYCMGRSFP